MIRIWDGNIVMIQEDSFNRIKFLEQYQEFENHYNTKFIIKSKDQIVSILDYNEILLNRVIKENISNSDGNIFEKARAYFIQIDNMYSGSCFGIIDEYGRIKFILEYLDNNNYVDKNRQNHFYRSFYDLNSLGMYDLDQLTALFSMQDIVIIESIEEYTTHLVRILMEERERFPNLKLYFLDSNAKKILNMSDSAIISDIKEIPASQKYMMIISKRYEETEYKSEGSRTTYKSIEVMTLLFERQVLERLSPKEDKKFIIYNDSYWGNGLVDIMKFSARNNALAQRNGYISVIDITDNVVYSNRKGENVWDYYFEPINEYTIDQVYASKNHMVISRRNGEMINQIAEEFRDKPMEYNEFIGVGNIKLKPEIIRFCEDKLPKQFSEGTSILGVISRGTDYNPPAVIGRRGFDNIKNGGVQQVIDETQRTLNQENYEYIYLATEDYCNYCQFKEVFGSRLIASDQERIDLSKNKKYIKSNLWMIPKKKGGFEFGLDYVAILYCLGKCDALITSMCCGAYVAAMAFNKEKYKKVTIVKSDRTIYFR